MSSESVSKPLTSLEPKDRLNYYSAYPETVIDPSASYQAVIRTSKGDMTGELYAADAPITVNNFVFLANEGYYDNTTFHRVIADFMAQAGDPSGTGMGGPGYSFGDEVSGPQRFTSGGILAMANSGPGTNGSQFFITYSPTPWLDSKHTIFGVITDGADILSTISLRDPSRSNTPGDEILSIDILETK